MPFDFDRIIERHGTDSLKYDFAVKRGLPADVLPLWVADMDFHVPPMVVDALVERSRHGIFGYSDAAGSDYFDALAAWYVNRFDWVLQPEWLVKTPGVVFALFAAIRALTCEGDSVLIQEPVYPPFHEAVLTCRRNLVVNPLVYEGGRYGLDLADFERKIVESKVRLFILCSPHNPVGRVWTEAELVAMGDVCVRHDVLVVADEIHSDLILPSHRHRSFARLRPAFANLAVTCTAPSKTFNLPGLQVANLLIPNPDLRREFVAEMHRTGYSQPNVMGLVACRAAYASGGLWLDELLIYLDGNFAYLKKQLTLRLPRVRPVDLEGTYLAWLDCRALGLSDPEIKRRLLEDGRLWLSYGSDFGLGGEGFLRLNLACPRATLEDALTRLVRALDGKDCST